MSGSTPSEVVRHLATWGLNGGPDTSLVVSGTCWDGVPAVVEHHQVTGPALEAIASGAVDDAPDEVVCDLARRHHERLRSVLLTEADLVRVCRRLDEHGIAHRVLKGCATAHLDHADPALRSTSDVDVLVRADELAVATEAVRTLTDPNRTVPDRRVAWTERYGKDRTLALAGGGWLDLHRSLTPGYHALVDRHDWFETADSYTVAGTELRALGSEDRFVNAVVHAGFADHVSLHSVRDVPVLLDRVDDWRGVVERHAEWSGLLARGIRTAWSSLGLDRHPIVDWAQAVAPSAREQLALRTFDISGSRQHWGAVLAVGPHRWPGLVGPLAVPSRAYLSRQGRSRGGHLRSTLVRLRSARQR